MAFQNMMYTMEVSPRFASSWNKILQMCFGVLGMVTFSDPKELRQALLEMDHHLVSSEMTAPEGGLASLVQHVLHVKLTEVSRENKDKINPFLTKAVRLCDMTCCHVKPFPICFLGFIFVALFVWV